MRGFSFDTSNNSRRSHNTQHVVSFVCSSPPYHTRINIGKALGTLFFPFRVFFINTLFTDWNRRRISTFSSSSSPHRMMAALLALSIYEDDCNNKSWAQFVIVYHGYDDGTCRRGRASSSSNMTSNFDLQNSSS